MKTISIVTGCYNEEEIIEEFHSEVLSVIAKIKSYKFEFIYIDNASTDNTYKKLLKIASKCKLVKLILNNKNFGHIRSPYWAIMQSQGSACIYLASDLQDPPQLIPKFIKEWELGAKLVWGQRTNTENSRFNFFIREMFYKILNRTSDIEHVQNCTGFGLYDHEVIDHIREINDPYPYLRGLVLELGYFVKTIPFIQKRRKKGKTKNNFFTLYDIMMLAFVSHSVFFIRAASFIGILFGLIAIGLSILVLFLKIFFWDLFPVGYAPFLIITLLMNGIILFFIGVIGEYINSIKGYVQKRPIVVEKERINFDI